MRVLLQRVRSAEVRVGGAVVGGIGAGYVALIGVARSDTATDVAWMAHKIPALRLWSDAAGKMNRSLLEAVNPPAVLAISQFTLLGDARRGLRPGFDAAAPPELARPLYEQLVEQLRQAGLHVATGIFQADMDVALVNQGPVTIWLDSRQNVSASPQKPSQL